MVLDRKGASTFFRNWLGLLAFVNGKYGLVKDFGNPVKPAGIDPENILTLKTKLWKNVKLIDEYIDSVWDLSNEDIQILKGWKNKISGLFIVINNLKKYSVFMDDKKNLLYGVVGISNPVRDVFPAEILPVMTKAVLLPFQGQIIYDSIFIRDNISFGPNMRRNWKELYSEIKKEKGIMSSLV